MKSVVVNSGTSSFLSPLFSVDEPLCESVECFNAAVAEEGPPSTYLFAAVKVDVDDLDDLLVCGGLVEDFALGTCDEAAAPELDEGDESQFKIVLILARSL